MHALAEFLPVEVPDQVLEKVLVELIRLRESVGVHLNQDLVLERLREGELRPCPVLDLAVAAAQQAV